MLSGFSRQFVCSIAATALAASALPVFASDQHETDTGPVRVERIAGPFEHPWAIAFLPEPNALLVTEREGALRVVRSGRISQPVANLPRV